MYACSEWAEGARRQLMESAELKQRLAHECLDSMLAAADLIAEVFRTGGKILLCGNDGRASDCQHLAAEFVSRFSKDITRPGLPAMALTTDTSLLTAYANDCGNEGVFERQVLTFGKPEDALIGISTSGNSDNVIRAIQAARAANLRTIVITGS